MSTELKKRNDHPFALRRYYGGADQGTCIQVSTIHRTPVGINMTREQAWALAKDLIKFAEGREEAAE